MKVILRFQDALQIVNDGLSALEANATETQKALHHELSKKDDKCLFLIHQCLDPIIFEKIMEEETTKSVCDTLKKLYECDKKLKKGSCNL